MIAHQDWFMLDIPPPPSNVAGLSPTPGGSFNELEQSPVMVGRPSQEEEWRRERIEKKGVEERDKKTTVGRLRPRRRANSTSERSSGPPTPRTPSPPPRLSIANMGGLVEGDMGDSAPVSPVTVTRSRTLPARRGEGSGASAAESHRNVLRKKGARITAPPSNDDSG